MYSLNLDYIFNRVYDAALSVKYVFYFWILGVDKQTYLADVKDYEWEGLRDRGWLDDAKASTTIIADNTEHATEKVSFLNSVLTKLGFNTSLDTDGDGIPNTSDNYPNDPNNFTDANKKELFSADMSWGDHVRSFFGISPRDTDGDGVPDSYEDKHGMNRLLVDTDRDGINDGEEVLQGSNAINSDTDGDGVMDGRDAFPLNHNMSVSDTDIDSDHDGVGDRYEKLMGTDPANFDTDHDGIPDGSDMYPTDANNNISHPADSITNVDGLSLHIQNGVLGFFADMLSVLYIFTIPIFIFMILRWYAILSDGISHYYHLYHHSIGFEDWMEKHFSSGKKNEQKNIIEKKRRYEESKHETHHDNNQDENHIVVNREEEKVIEHFSHVPSVKEYEKHPRWAIVESYMSDPHEAMWRIGLLEADNMLGEVLRSRGYLGRDIGEMLAGANFSTVQDAWHVHKIRNRIAHEGSRYILTEREARIVAGVYEKVFKDLNVI